jgi:hypothetical protein
MIEKWLAIFELKGEMMRGKLQTCLIFAFISIIVLSSGVTVFADENTVALESVILDAFDGKAYEVDGETYDLGWNAVGSRYTTVRGDVQYPKVGIIATAPLALVRKNAASGSESHSLGVQGSFDRQGFNWIDVYPVLKGGDGTTPFEIPLQGRPYYIDVWTWGSNLNYYMEAYIRDRLGVIHTIPMGSLRYAGWKNLRANIPANLPMVPKILPRSVTMTTFVKFRIWTEPTERTVVERRPDGTIVPFDVYLSQLKVFSDLYETIYDGDELSSQKETNRLWNEAGTGQ